MANINTICFHKLVCISFCKKKKKKDFKIKQEAIRTYLTVPFKIGSNADHLEILLISEDLVGVNPIWYKSKF